MSGVIFGHDLFCLRQTVDGTEHLEGVAVLDMLSGCDKGQKVINRIAGKIGRLDEFLLGYVDADEDVTLTVSGGSILSGT